MHVRTLLATTAVLVLALTGCGDDDPEPKIQPTETVQPTETESPEPESVEAFLDLWADTETRMLNSGETGPYREITEGCAACTSAADDMERIYSNGGFVKTKGVSIDRVEHLNGTNYLVWGYGNVTTYKERAGGKLRTIPAGRIHYRLSVDQGADGFNVSFLVNRPL